MNHVTAERKVRGVGDMQDSRDGIWGRSNALFAVRCEVTVSARQTVSGSEISNEWCQRARAGLDVAVLDYPQQRWLD
jgi:hypothetical protein